jgi:hypothetical protein
VPRALAIAATVILVLVTAVMLILMLNISGLPLCDELGPRQLADECIEASSGERAFGLIVGWASVVCGLAAIWLGIRLARRRRGGPVFTAAAGLTPVLGLLAIAFLPVSF